MIIGAVTAEASSSCLKVCIEEEQRDVVSVVEKRIESFLHPASGSKEMGSTALTMEDMDGKTIIQFRRTLWKKTRIKKFMTQKINFGKSKY